MLDNLANVLPGDEAESGLDTLLFPMRPDDGGAVPPALSPTSSAEGPSVCDVYVVRHGQSAPLPH